jgi:membrane-associated PAP2 superfamily phosphatase
VFRQVNVRNPLKPLYAFFMARSPELNGLRRRMGDFLLRGIAMANPNLLYVSRPFNFYLGIGIPVAFMILMLALDTTAIDFSVAHMFFEADTGFVGHRHHWLESVMHDGVKQAVIVLAAALAVGWAISLYSSRWAEMRRPLGFILLAMGLSTAVVTPLKAMTGIQCPWSLTEFGGSETYSGLLQPRPETARPGRCWPGGHASTGFSLMALYFALRDRRPRAARLALAFALGLGAILSACRMLQGAHFLSHNIWTMLIDWVICVVCYRFMLFRQPGTRAPRFQAA